MFKRFGLIIILILVLAFIVACGSDGQTNGETEEPTIQATAVETDLVEGVLPAKESIEEVSCIQNPELCMVIDEDTPLCPIFPTLDGQAYNARDVEDGDLLATVLDLSHGEVVFNTIIDGMAPMGFTPASIDFSLDPENAVIILVLDNFKKPSATDSPDLLPMDALYQDVSHIGSILVAGVDIGDFEIKQLSQRIQDAITNLPTVQKYVINMSFALVPCNEALRLTLAAYLTGDDDETNFDNLQMILEDLIEFTYGTGHSNALTLTQNDDFFGFIECLSGKNQKFDESYQLDKNYQLEDRTCDQLEVPASTNIILVGAAGNSGPGYLFPFAPALWNQVVSVSASEIDGVMANYSNTGEVMMLGTTQYTDVSVPLDDGSTILTDVVGTSFASPRLALDRAQYLLSITDSNLGFKCQGNAGIWASPPLGYIPEAGDWESGVTTDLMLTDAKSEYCP